MSAQGSATLFGEGISGVRVAGASLRSLEAGLISLLLLSATLATFGVWFNLPLAYVLTGASVAVGLLGLHWAHQASHALRGNPKLVGKAHARLGAMLAFFGLFGSSYANGLLFLMMHPVAWIFWISVGAVLLLMHYDRRSREDTLLKALDAPSGTYTCAQCGARIAIGDGSSTEDRWICKTCSLTAGAHA